MIMPRLMVIIRYNLILINAAATLTPQGFYNADAGY